MAAALGNQYAAKSRVWTTAINNVLERKHPKGRMAALEDLAERLIAGVEAGDLAAIKEIGDRVEGKPSQAVIHAGDDEGGPIRAKVSFEFVNHKDT